MSPRRWPQPAERAARMFRRAHERMDRERIQHLERAGFGYEDGFHGAYAERPGYARPRGFRQGPEREGSGWPDPVAELPAEAEDRHLRALRDRDLARAVSFALYNTLGRAADRITVYCADAVVTLEGVLPARDDVRDAVDVARWVPGVRRVRNALWIRPARPRPPQLH